MQADPCIGLATIGNHRVLLFMLLVSMLLWLCCMCRYCRDADTYVTDFKAVNQRIDAICRTMSELVSHHIHPFHNH